MSWTIDLLVCCLCDDGRALAVVFRRMDRSCKIPITIDEHVF